MFAYMAAYTATNLDFLREGFSLVRKGTTIDGVHYESCRILWWDYVTEVGELTILIFGIHLGYASRNARTQFHVSKKEKFSGYTLSLYTRIHISCLKIHRISLINFTQGTLLNSSSFVCFIMVEHLSVRVI